MKFFKNITDYVSSMKDDINYIRKAKPYLSVLKDKEFTQEIVRSHFSEFDKDDQARILMLTITAIYNYEDKNVSIKRLEDLMIELFDIDYDDYKYFINTVTEENYDTKVKSILDGPEGSLVNDIVVFALNYFRKY
jgi:hypothetical protein